MLFVQKIYNLNWPSNYRGKDSAQIYIDIQVLHFLKINKCYTFLEVGPWNNYGIDCDTVRKIKKVSYPHTN